MSENFEHLTDIPEIQDFIDSMNPEVCPNSTSNIVPSGTNTLNNIGLVLEVTVAIKLSSNNYSQTNIINKVLIDTGCTKLLKEEIVFESQKQSKEVSWTTNTGKFMTKYNISLQLLLPEFCTKPQNQLERCC
jgi:hypothetical protein